MTDNERGRELPHDGEPSGLPVKMAATSYPPAPFRPLSAFLAELRQHAEQQGQPPLTVSEREEIRAAFMANLGKVSPEAMAITCTPEAITETQAAIAAHTAQGAVLGGGGGGHGNRKTVGKTGSERGGKA